MLLDRDIATCRALVVDPNPTSRSILAAQLRDFGVGTVQQTSRVADARRALEFKSFDIVLCEQYFTQDGQTGQDLLDDLRRAQLLPYATVFVMISGEARYDKVAEAAESALDGYLLKPYTAAALGERLKQARRRKRELGAIFEAIEAGEFEAAARLCLDRFQARGPFWLYAARIGAELLLRLQRHGAARELYDAVLEAQALPWARLGIARAHADEGQAGKALRTLETLLASDPGYTDAYDVMGRVQVEQGQFDQALATFRLASGATPNSVTRLQKQGMLAFYLGEADEASRALERAILLGAGSKMFDPQSLVLQSLLRFRERDSRGLQRAAEHLDHMRERDDGNERLARFAAVVRVLQDMLAKRVASSVAGVRNLAAQSSRDDFDVEAACNLLALLAEVSAAELQLDEIGQHVDDLALRFAGSRGITELLARSVARHPPFEQRVREGHHRITQLAEQSLSHALAGNARGAVKALIEHAGTTGNAKLLDTAGLSLHRYRDKIDDAADLAIEIDALRQRFALAAGAPALGRAGARSSGGIVLRADAGGPATDVQRRAA
ncbi:MAG TPA: tetratricopeptide repeat protein [Burkholderiaceae bacterium]|nr:tetratricopeptide repeat protein [Burkholderiaceae bacterium]